MKNMYTFNQINYFQTLLLCREINPYYIDAFILACFGLTIMLITLHASALSNILNLRGEHHSEIKRPNRRIDLGWIDIGQNRAFLYDRNDNTGISIATLPWQKTFYLYNFSAGFIVPYVTYAGGITLKVSAHQDNLTALQSLRGPIFNNGLPINIEPPRSVSLARRAYEEPLATLHVNK